MPKLHRMIAQRPVLPPRWRPCQRHFPWKLELASNILRVFVGKPQKNRWLFASIMHCNLCPQRQKSTCQSFLEPLIVAYGFYHSKIYNFISVSQTQIWENPNNLNNVESYSLANNYYWLTKLLKTDASRKILREKY